MIHSLLTTDNPINSTEQLRAWIEQRNREVQVDVKLIPFKEMDGWYVDDEGSLRHNSGRFFTIQGIHVETDYGNNHAWDQPIINQPEIGYLGILTKEINGTLYFLMQAKIEPGNVNCVQISPTLQATKSNYTQVHKGKKPAYLDYFVNVKPENVLLDQLQSEQGARFLRKRNRNIIIKVDEEVEVLPDFRWMTLGQIKEFMHTDNMVNMDTRTVLSGIEYIDYITPLTNLSNLSDFGRDMLKSARTSEGIHSMGQILSWLSGLKSRYDLFVSNKPIDKLEGWHRNETEIANNDGKYFCIIGDSPRSSAFNRFLLPVASEPSHLVASQDKGLRQIAKQIYVKQPSRFASNSQANLRQTAKQIYVKQPSKIASNSQIFFKTLG